MIERVLVETDEHKQYVRNLYLEYLQYVNQVLEEMFDLSIDVQETVERDMREIYKLSPPMGRLFLAQRQNQILGIGGLRQIGESTGEVKRMFVRPAYQSNGVGRALLDRLIAEARQIGYGTLRLDVGPYAAAARSLYLSAGFVDIAPYEESEVPPDMHHGYDWKFMEMPLR